MLPPVTFSRLRFPVFLALALFATALRAQEGQQGFYDVQMSKDDVYTYTNLKFKGDYTTFESTAGAVVLGKTDAGVTVVVVLGEGTLTIETPDSAKESLKTVFGSYPFATKFKSIFMRLSPKEYEETFGKAGLKKAPSDELLAQAKAQYDLYFLASYHAGPRAILPPYKSRVFEFETVDHGHVSNEEGYWLKLLRRSPYGKVYPSSFPNPKQKYG